MKNGKQKITRIILYIWIITTVILAVYFFTIPGILVIRSLRDPALKNGEIPAIAWKVHRHIAPGYATWAHKRIAENKGAKVHYLNITATEWPLFGSVFYLYATTQLQSAWEEGNAPKGTAEPIEYARDTIEACKDILLDPGHHSWVRTHWGDNYMHTNNLFFRSLLIAGLTEYERLVGTGAYISVLRDQVETLAQELDDSPTGLLYDYPGECYPLDVFAAVAYILRANEILGTDHSAFVERERRAFTGKMCDNKGLIPWMINPITGKGMSISVGIVNSYKLIFAPELYPKKAKEWYDIYEKHFWEDRWWGEGFREYPKDVDNMEWTYTVDAGPLIKNFSPAGNAFGVAAARKNGRMDHAYILASQLIAASWPLPNGRLLGGMILSDREHAPYLGEAAILWLLTVTPEGDIHSVEKIKTPGSIYIAMVFYFGISGLIYINAIYRIRKYHRSAAVKR